MTMESGDLLDMVENIADLTVEDMKRHLSLSETSTCDTDEYGPNTVTEDPHKACERKAELEKCQTLAVKTVTEAMEAVRGMAVGSRMAEEATLAVVVAARAVAALASAAKASGEDKEMISDLEQRLQGLLQLHKGLQHHQLARQHQQRGHPEQEHPKGPLARSPDILHQKVSSPATNKFSCSTSTRYR